jgi:hypothetical protein
MQAERSPKAELAGGLLNFVNAPAALTRYPNLILASRGIGEAIGYTGPAPGANRRSQPRLMRQSLSGSFRPRRIFLDRLPHHVVELAFDLGAVALLFTGDAAPYE